MNATIEPNSPPEDTTEYSPPKENIPTIAIAEEIYGGEEEGSQEGIIIKADLKEGKGLQNIAEANIDSLAISTPHIIILQQAANNEMLGEESCPPIDSQNPIAIASA